MVLSPSLPAIGEYWYVYSLKMAGHTDIVGRFIPAILLECEDFVSFLPAIMTSCKHYCRPLEANYAI